MEAKRMEKETIAYILGQQCAPVLAGVKPSNLLIVNRGSGSGLDGALCGTHIGKHLLYSSAEKDYWFLFEEEKLRELLKNRELAGYLEENGYETGNVETVLKRLVVRFARYKKYEAEFPHEMGILFGYPLKDVQGFIENRGRNFKMSGYWKVYDDVAYAGSMFRLYEFVKDMVLELCRSGVCISDICRACRSAGRCLATDF